MQWADFGLLGVRSFYGGAHQGRETCVAQRSGENVTSRIGQGGGDEEKRSDVRLSTITFSWLIRLEGNVSQDVIC